MSGSPIRRTPVRLTRSRSKYGVRTDAAGKAARTVDGICFDSKAEARRYAELKLLEKAGAIEHLAVHRAFDLTVNDNPEWPENADVIGQYVCDFSFFDRQTQKLVVEDVKSGPTRTALYRWKKKHFEAQYGIRIREVFA